MTLTVCFVVLHVKRVVARLYCKRIESGSLKSYRCAFISGQEAWGNCPANQIAANNQCYDWARMRAEVAVDYSIWKSIRSTDPDRY